jgi:hypothetical protein
VEKTTKAIQDFKVSCSVADQGSDAFLPPGYGIRIRDTVNVFLISDSGFY